MQLSFAHGLHLFARNWKLIREVTNSAGFKWSEFCLFHHFARKTEPSKRPSASVRLSSRSAHRVQKPLLWARGEKSIFLGL